MLPLSYAHPHLGNCQLFLQDLLHFLPLHEGLVLIIQIVIGAAFYLLVSYAIKFEPFIYLIKMVREKFHK